MKTFIAFLLTVIITSVYSQWNSNPSVNLQISDLNGDQATPKIAATTDGGCYIAWFDNRGGTYAVYLQRLNVLGVKQFAPDGFCLSAVTRRTARSSAMTLQLITAIMPF